MILVLRGVSLQVPEGGIVALLGANGAGKTTTLKAILNLLRAERGDVARGQILYQGARVDSLTPNELVRRGTIQADYISGGDQQMLADRPGTDVEVAYDASGRAVDGPGAAAGRANL